MDRKRNTNGPVLWILLWRAVAAQTAPEALNLVVVQGEGTINQTGQRAEKYPTVRVEDADHQALSGATVVFTLPTNGASGEFAKSGKTLLITTDKQGLATAGGLKANGMPGKFLIHVNASYKGRVGRLIITEFNFGPEKSHSGGNGKLIALLALAGGAAAGGAFAALHKSSSTGASSAPPIVLTAGSTTVGAPH
jgi:hypothetical protein